MVDRIYELKNQVLDRIEQTVAESGMERMDVEEMSKMVDMVKDLAEAEKQCWEAEYYQAISKSMGQQGYQQGYQQRSGYRWGNQYGSGNVRGYQHGMSGHTDMLDSVRMAMQGMAPDERERMREQLRGVLDGSM